MLDCLNRNLRLVLGAVAVVALAQGPSTTSVPKQLVLRWLYSQALAREIWFFQWDSHDVYHSAEFDWDLWLLSLKQYVALENGHIHITPKAKEIFSTL